ncbi:hypothetical protein GCM10009555_062670 [Acrocarpospora macrocephala]|uniref:HTH gntR-type domain-containing protein n=1 Tax=Acrocarpospora macrocephala TaxID=150177 RepID=A0A5M3WNB3_9ACTN|nr:hypothetical protein [Acrocarpospora macrocephala]GES07798.1 hypothetical protein Amac_013930 [Acrocarpospora macrocephala]
MSEQDAYPGLGHDAESGHVDEDRLAQRTISASDGSGVDRRVSVAQRRREIAADLAEQITSGRLSEGSPIPTVKQLIVRHDISKWAALRIQGDLRDRRLVRLIPGGGYVAGPPGDEPPPTVPVQERIEQIANEWAGRIRGGEIGVHQRIPGVPRMRRMYGISKYAAHEVIIKLDSLGLVYILEDVGPKAAPRDCWVGEDPPEEKKLSSIDRYYARQKRLRELHSRKDEVRDEQMALIRDRSAQRGKGRRTR